MVLGRYNAKDTNVIVDGTYITGLGEDMISGSKDEDFFSPAVGAQGDVIRNEINNPLGTVTITIQPTSPQRAFLLSLANILVSSSFGILFLSLNLQTLYLLTIPIT